MHAAALAASVASSFNCQSEEEGEDDDNGVGGGGGDGGEASAPRGLQQLSSFQCSSGLGEIPLRGERWGVRKEGRKEGR